MSIPKTETKPDGLQNLPPQQRRSLRKYIGTANTRDKNELLRDIARHSLPRMQHYGQLLFCLLLLVVGNLLGSNLVFLAGIIAMPMAKPLLSLIYAGALPSARHFWQALLGLIITLAGFFLAGWIVRSANPVQMDSFLAGVDLSGVTEGGLFWAILIITAALTAYWFTYHDALSRLSSVLIGYLVLMPFFAAGQSAPLGFVAGSLPLLTVGLSRLSLALLVMFLTTWVLGFGPREVFGIFIAVLILTVATVSLIEIIHREQSPPTRLRAYPGCCSNCHASAPHANHATPDCHSHEPPQPHPRTHSEPGTNCNSPGLHFSARDRPKWFGHS